MSVASSQSLATRDFTFEINPDPFTCNKAKKIRTNVTLSPRYQTKETGKLTCLQPRLKLASHLVLGKAGIIISMKINPWIRRRYSVTYILMQATSCQRYPIDPDMEKKLTNP